MQATSFDRLATYRMPSTGLYLYAVVDCGENLSFKLEGMDGATVRAISDGSIAAVVSEVPNAKIRPERRRLANHHEVLKSLRDEFTVLPMTFGLIANGPAAVRDILARHHGALREQICRVAGKVEMGLRVCWDVANIFEYFVATQAELRALRDHVFRGGRQPTKDELIDLGRSFDRLLSSERAELTLSVTQVLRTRSFEIKELKPRDEREIMNLACLVGQNLRKEFEEGIVEAARRFDQHFAFDFNGPWLPYNFVEMSLEL